MSDERAKFEAWMLRGKFAFLDSDGRWFTTADGAGMWLGWQGRAQLSPPADESVQIDALIERIASEWDGCFYDDIGGHTDIGRAIRRVAKAISAAMAKGD